MTITDYINSKQDKNARLAILDCNGCIIVEDDFRNYAEPHSFNISFRSNYIREVAYALDFLYDAYSLRDFEVVNNSETLVKFEIEYIDDIYTSHESSILKRSYIKIPTYGIQLENILTVTCLNICCYIGISNVDYDKATDIFYHRLYCSRHYLYPTM